MDHLKPEPLSTAHLPGLEELWGGPAVIRYTNIAKPRDKAAAAHRLFQPWHCRAALPGPTIFAVLRDRRFCGIAGCPPVDAAQETFRLSYQLLRPEWGRGAGKSAARMALDELYRLSPWPWSMPTWRRKTPPASVFRRIRALCAPPSIPPLFRGRGRLWTFGAAPVAPV